MESLWDCLGLSQLYIELHNLSKDGKLVSDFLFQAKKLADSLALTSRSLSSVEFNAIVYHQLGAEFNGMIGALQ